VESLVKEIAKEAAKYRGQYEGAAVSMPGRIDTAKGIAHTGGAFHFFCDTPFGAMLEEALGVPVILANDGKCAAMAEIEAGALKDVENGAVLLLGTGLGGGIVLNRKVLMGSTFGAGEFSWMIYDYNSFARHTFSDYSALDDLAANVVSASALTKSQARKMNIPETEMDGIRFFELYDQGDETAIATLSELAVNATSCIFTIQAVLDLDRYAIGGGISARKEVTDAIRNAVEQRFSQSAIVPFQKPEIVTCVYRNDANLIGALRFLQERIGSE
jgi:predicted NBD/HSP70 family sugar kinase